MAKNRHEYKIVTRVTIQATSVHSTEIATRVQMTVHEDITIVRLCT